MSDLISENENESIYNFNFEKFTWSKSSVNTFFNCPKSFEFNYVKKVKGTPNQAMIKGSKIHTLLEQLNKNKLCLDSVTNSYKVHLLNYLEFLKQWNLKLPQYSETKYTSNIEGLNFTGIVDAVFVDGVKAIIIDYKTGQGSISLKDYRFELQLYSKLIEENLKVEVVNYGILFTSNKLFLYEKNNRRYEEILINLTTLKKNIQEKQFKFEYNSHCQTCQFKPFCNINK